MSLVINCSLGPLPPTLEVPWSVSRLLGYAYPSVSESIDAHSSESRIWLKMSVARFLCCGENDMCMDPISFPLGSDTIDVGKCSLITAPRKLA